MMIVVTAKMSLQPRRDNIGSNDGKGPSQPDENTRNILDTTQALKTVASISDGGFGQRKGEGTPSGSKGFSFKEFYKYPFHMFKGNLNSGEARD